MQNLGSRSMMHISRLHAVQTSQARSSETAERVVVFTTPGCQYCRKAKQTLTDLQVPYKVRWVRIQQFQGITAFGQLSIRGRAAVMVPAVVSDTGVLSACVVCCTGGQRVSQH